MFGWVSILVILGLLGAAFGLYLALSSGRLPFTFADGVAGIPVWLPAVVLAALVGAAIATPRLLSRFDRQEEGTFYRQIRINRRNTWILTIAVLAGLALSAYLVFTTVSLHANVGLVAAGLAVGAGLMGALVSWVAGDRVVLSASQAQPLPAGERPILRDVVDELAVAASIPPPRLYLIDAAAPNAFATGRDPQNAALAVTTGLLDSLDREELQGVIAHELAHIRNLDTRYGQFVAVLVGATVLVADGFFRLVTLPFWAVGRLFGDSKDRRVHGGGSSGSWSWGGGGSDGGGGDGDGGDGGLAILAVVIFVLMVMAVAFVVKAVAPFISKLIQVSVSREREYLADATAVEIGRNPEALERALLVVAQSPIALSVANRATAPLFFVTPIRAWEDRARGIWATHPPTIDRVNRLRLLRGEAPLPPSAADQIQDDND